MVSAVARDYLAAGPSRGTVSAAFSERQWLAAVVLAACAGLALLALAVGPDSMSTMVTDRAADAEGGGHIGCAGPAMIMQASTVR